MNAVVTEAEVEQFARYCRSQDEAKGWPAKDWEFYVSRGQYHLGKGLPMPEGAAGFAPEPKAPPRPLPVSLAAVPPRPVAPPAPAAVVADRARMAALVAMTAKGVEQDGVAHLWTLTRSDDGRWQLHAESNDHRFPAELHDLSESEAWDYMAEPMRSEGRERSTIMVEDGVEFQPKAASPINHYTYTPRMLADRWGCKVAQVRYVIRSGRLDAFRAGPRLLMVRGEVVQAYEGSRLPEVVTAEMQAERDAVEAQRQKVLNEGRLMRRMERRVMAPRA